jgi:AcrR family transcriptional regulator
MMVNNSIDSEKKAEIYKKALDLFIEKGFTATPLSEIARVAQMSKANLYYYCPNKEHLLYEIHLNHLRENFIPLLDKTEQIADPLERLQFLLRNFSLQCTTTKAAPVLVGELRSLSKAHQNEILTIWRRGYGLIRSAIEELQASKKGKEARSSFLAFLGTGMVFWTLHWWDYSRRDNADELADLVAEVFFNGILSADNKVTSKRKNRRPV